MPKSKPRPVTVPAPQKGRSKPKGGIPLDELLAAHASGRTVRATEKTPARASATAKPPKPWPKKASGRRLPRRDAAQVNQDGPPRLGGLRADLDGRPDDGTASRCAGTRDR
jgi:hypothetical protein